MNRLRRLLSLNALTVTLASMAAAIALFFSEVALFELLELRSYDMRLRWRGAIEPHPAISIAVVDEASLDSGGRWPWPRSRIADLIDRLSQAGARVIVFDIGFLEPDASSELALLDDLAAEVAELEQDSDALDALIGERRRRADTDGALAAAIARSSASVVLGYFFHGLDERAGAISETELDRQLGLIETSAYTVEMSEGATLESGSPFTRAAAPEGNLPILAEVAASSGFFTVQQDQDGTVRRLLLAIECGPLEEVFPPTAVLAAWHYLGEPPMSVRVDAHGVVGVAIGERFVPTDERGRLLLNYAGPPETLPHVSAIEILAGTANAELLRDRIVFVGVTATGAFDMRNTPFKTVFPGVEIHATAVDNILSGRFVQRPRWVDVYDLAAIVVLCAAVGAALPRAGPVAGAAIAAFLATLHVGVAREFFLATGIPLGIVYPLAGALVTYVGLTAYFFVAEQRERRRVQGAFGHYVSPVVIDRILDESGGFELGGQEKELSVLFSDLQGFTSSSERYSPAQMTQFLGDYYGRMTEEIFGQDGMLKEYVGDELMAIFGAPIDQPDHAERACATALAMRRTRNAMSEQWVAEGKPSLHARTGVNSGVMLIGNIGSEYRVSYGAVGDQVNLGSRLEGMNKVYGSEILIGENTAALIGESFLLREIDQVRVVGKHEPTRIFELIDRADVAEPVAARAIAHYAAGLEAYRALAWSEAEKLFTACRELWPQDRPSAVMAERCREYIAKPPPDAWDGVYEATKK